MNGHIDEQRSSLGFLGHAELIEKVGKYNIILDTHSVLISKNIKIGDSGRYCDGANIIGETVLGNGSQILGSITVQNCTLADGGTFQETDPDKRAAVLKGFGLARNISLRVGEVVNGLGDFSKAPVERQSFYHSKMK